MVDKKSITDIGDNIARAFKPERIILFGPHAYGKPGPDSDVDILVIMPFWGSNADTPFPAETRHRRYT